MVAYKVAGGTEILVGDASGVSTVVSHPEGDFLISVDVNDAGAVVYRFSTDATGIESVVLVEGSSTTTIASGATTRTFRGSMKMAQLRT